MLEKRNYHHISSNKFENKVWIFGVIFLLFSGYLMWNNFELPKFFFGNDDHVLGQIYDINLRSGMRGIGQIQAVKYFYKIDGINYKGAKLVDNRHGAQKIGNYVEVQYSKGDPNYHNVMNFLPNEAFNIKLNLKGSDANYRIKLEKKFYCLEEIINNRKVQAFGQFELYGDTLLLKKFIFKKTPIDSFDFYLIDKSLNEVKKLKN